MAFRNAKTSSSCKLPFQWPRRKKKKWKSCTREIQPWSQTVSLCVTITWRSYLFLPGSHSELSGLNGNKKVQLLAQKKKNKKICIKCNIEMYLCLKCTFKSTNTDSIMYLIKGTAKPNRHLLQNATFPSLLPNTGTRTTMLFEVAHCRVLFSLRPQYHPGSTSLMNVCLCSRGRFCFHTVHWTDWMQIIIFFFLFM